MLPVLTGWRLDDGHSGTGTDVSGGDCRCATVLALDDVNNDECDHHHRANHHQHDDDDDASRQSRHAPVAVTL